MSVCPTCQASSDEGARICPVDGTVLASGDMAGQVLGDRYRIVARIGGGGMGTVWLAEHVMLGKRVAVKILRPEYSRDEELTRRFQQEAVAASQIGQENIVDVTDFGRTPDGSLYLVMEALEGESLASILRHEGLLPLDRALLILFQISRALAAAHARGIVHRDLKPENVFVTRHEDGTDFVKVLDFGISKIGAAPEGGRITRAGAIMGTPEYMAPEQASSGQVDQRCDVYAFGVLAYEVLTGSLPFQGDNPVATLLKHQSDSPPPLRRRRPALPIEAEDLVLKALVKRPEGRQQSMAEVTPELSRAMDAAGLGPVFTPVGAGNGRGTARLPPLPPPSRLHSARGETMALDPDDTGPVKSAATPVTTPSAEPPRRSRPPLLAGLAPAPLAGAAAAFLLLGPGARGGRPAPPAAAIPPAAPRPGPVLAAAALDPEPVRVHLRSVPTGAAVYEGDERLGVTPLDVELPAGGHAVYRFARAGYRTLARRVRAADGEVVEVRLPRSAVQELPPAPRAEENPYGKVDDLKDPFGDDARPPR